VLFALNYGVFLLKIKMGDAFNTALAFLIVGALIAGSIYLLRKKGDG
jgi:LPXTG-motif cell wall-anchored protein